MSSVMPFFGDTRHPTPLTYLFLFYTGCHWRTAHYLLFTYLIMRYIRTSLGVTLTKKRKTVFRQYYSEGSPYITLSFWQLSHKYQIFLKIFKTIKSLSSIYNTISIEIVNFNWNSKFSYKIQKSSTEIRKVAVDIF